MGGGAKKQAVQSGAARGGVFADRPLAHRPRPSEVCVSSLMKKFWYLGETLLSAERTHRCPRTLNRCPTQTQTQTPAPALALHHV